jgi:hypothetical protein
MAGTSLAMTIITKSSDVSPHPEERVFRASRRMKATDRATWFETLLARLLTMRR